MPEALRREPSTDKAHKPVASLPDRLWSLFTSLKLAISVIIILAVASVAGTLIEQNAPMEKYRQVYTDGAIRIMEALSLFDMYHSWWFLLLLVLFTVNLSCCTLDRLPRVVRTVRNPKVTLDEGLEKTLGLLGRWKKKGAVGSLAPAYEAAMAKAFAKPRATRNSETLHLYAERGAYSRFGVYVTHLSIVVIFVGAIIGNVWGFKGWANIVEGQSVQVIPTRGGQGSVDLGFAVRCNRFWVETYPNGQPKEYSSDLSVIDNGREVLRETIEVNSPLRYKGVWFYQSSYGQAGVTSATVDVKRADGGLVSAVDLAPGRKVSVPGYGTLSAVNYEANLQGFGPALLVVLEKPGRPPAEFWLLKTQPEFDRRREDTHYLSFTGLDEVFYTGLQVARDPGVNVVWAGCLLMVAGIMIAFFSSHQRVWLRLGPVPDGRVEVLLAGSATRNRLAFERRFEKIQADLKGVST